MQQPPQQFPLSRGLENVAIAETRLSRVDGDAGELVIGGYALEELASRAEFEETLFLLWNDRLPTLAELAGLHGELASRRALPAPTLALLEAAAAADVAPMDALRMAIGSLGVGEPALHATELQAEPNPANQQRALRLVAAVPTAVAAFARLQRGVAPVAPDPSLGHAANYLWMLNGEPPKPEVVRALGTYLNTAVDHGMNASTFTARVVTSTRSDIGSAIVAALGALKGPLHGGAPGPALDMVIHLQEEAERSGESLDSLAERWVHDALDAGRRIMGFGHRVYRVRDPRADVLGAAVDRLFPDPAAASLPRAAREVEAVVLRVLAERKPDRPLQTNVEFYTALLLAGIGLPTPLFTPTFAVARVVGWTAHVLEQIEEDRLIRPRVHYAGELGRRWLSPDERAA
ncbi:MAG: citrate synthase [Myxococcota bacterium]